MLIPPKVFVSHASEDKERFVEEFATRLRVSGGVDAWVDQWEMTPGDSLVDGIFERGIGTTTVFVAVVSKVSLQKPWVKEELAVAIERSVNEDYKIIPVLLDDLQRSDLPIVLRHRVWVSHKGDMSATVGEVQAGIFSIRSSKPQLGRARPYLDRPGTHVALVDDPLDNRVLEAILDSLVGFGSVNVVFLTSDVATELYRTDGVTADEFDESMHALVNRGLLNATPMLNAPGRWLLGHTLARTWLARAEQQGIDVESAKRRLAIDALNSEGGRYSAKTFENLEVWTTQAVFEDLAASGLAESVTTADGTHHLHNLSPLLKRWVNSSDT